MLRSVQRSLLHAGHSRHLRGSCPTASSCGSTQAILTETLGQCLKRSECQIPWRGVLCMRPMSSAAGSMVRGRGHNRDSKEKVREGLPVVSSVKLPPNLKLAVEFEELLAEGVDQGQEHEQKFDGDEDKASDPSEDCNSSFVPGQGQAGLTNTEVEVVSWLKGGSLGKRSLDPQVFGVPSRRDVVHEVIRWQLAKRRAGSAKTKRIGEISGSGRKVRPQKKQGIARAGHSRPPHWRGGAKAHGPRIRDWSYKLNKKFIKLGLRVALSARLREGKLKVVDQLTSDGFSTSAMLNTMKERGVDESALIIDGEFPPSEFMKSISNVVGVKVLPARGANVYDVVKRTDLVISEAAVSHLERVLKPI